MENTPGIEGALDAALDALLSGDRESLLEAIRILETHPRADELRRLLTSAIETRETVRAAPSEAARLRHIRLIGLACREQVRVRAAREAGGSRRLRRFVLRPVAVAAGAFGLLIPGALAVASTAQPGDALYAAKLTVEQVQLAFTKDPTADIALHMRFAERRMEEIDRLEDHGRSGAPLAAAASNLKSHADAVKQGIRQGSNAPAGLAATLERHRDGLTELAGKARCDEARPGAGCDGLERALESSTLALTQLKEAATPPATSPSPGPSGSPVTGRPGPSPAATVAASPTLPAKDKKSGARARVATDSPTASASPTPTASPDATASPSPAPDASPTPSPDPSASPSPDPSASPTLPPSPTPDPSPQPLPQPTDLPTDSAGTGTIEPHSGETAIRLP